MKKTFKTMLFGSAVVMALTMTSCASSISTKISTASGVDIAPTIVSQTIADLKVAPERISYTMIPTDAVRRGGLDNIILTAQAEMLQQNGNADVLVERQYTYTTDSRGAVSSITISGRPAKYVNIRPAK